MFKLFSCTLTIALCLLSTAIYAQQQGPLHHSIQFRSGGEKPVAKVSLDYFELRGQNGAEIEGDFTYGGDVNKVGIEVDFERTAGEVERKELWGFYSRAITANWNLIAGIRHDFQLESNSRNWGLIGIVGETPYSLELDVVFFVGKSGSTALRIEGEYDLKIEEKWSLVPRCELNFFGQNDEEIGTGSGLSELELGIRLFYKVSPKFSPYAGVHYSREIGNSADFAREEGEDVGLTVWALGFRAWF
ncbi:copper resistance protein B [uncultured Microbulbifer sp.]|uniref:copper resistance protein B n=1 Tax=uncultured Microbulbifer sp. TaxID=348147 RepID=UPI002608512F|nr:copper resistance protein B [uncultured Microbulbifer sp.]